jgi:hypothetical protein
VDLNAEAALTEAVSVAALRGRLGDALAVAT